MGTLELELACHASLRAPPLLLARALRGSVPERGSNWINAILVPLARVRGCAKLIHWGCELSSPMGELAQGAWVCRALHDAAAAAAGHVTCSSAYTSQQA